MAEESSAKDISVTVSNEEVRQSVLPDFFLLGAAKSGTTSLHHYLRQHPALYLPEVKELDFFDALADRFRTEFDWYLSYFRNVEAQLTGEATPLYFRRPDRVARRMRRLYDAFSPRFVLLFRDPVHRAYSHYLHKVSQGTEPLAFNEALEAERTHPKQKRYEWKSYFQDGLYAETLRGWLKYFPEDQFLVLLSRDLRERPQTALRTIFDFLNVDPEVKIDTSLQLNRTDERQSRVLGRFLSVLPSWLPPLAQRWTPKALRLWIEQFIRQEAWGTERDAPALDPQIERRLRRRYAPQVRELADMIDRDLTGWLPAGKPSPYQKNRARSGELKPYG